MPPTHAPPTRVPLVALRKADQNRRGLDPWTVVHLSTGLALGLMGVPRRQAVVSAVIYELAEQVLERLDVGKELFRTAGPEVPLNAVLDVAVFALGHRLGQLWNAT